LRIEGEIHAIPVSDVDKQARMLPSEERVRSISPVREEFLAKSPIPVLAS